MIVPVIQISGVDHYYEIKGVGTPLVLVHGGFVDRKMWDPQFEYFADRYCVFILCGLSLGGMIAQSFAVRYTGKLKALVLADTAVSVRLTMSDKFQRYILAPKWAMLAAIRWMTVKRFVNFSFWLAQFTRSSDWFGRDSKTLDYVHAAMLNTTTEEYLKIYDAIYEFDLLELGLITIPTLILNGEHESKAVFRHTEEMLKHIPNAETHVVAGAGHTSNMENADGFNTLLDRFLEELE